MSVSRFTPSMMKHEDLESILVQRHQLAKQIVDAIRESAVTSSKHHTLLIGSRGMGKTYLVSLVYHRIRNLDDCKNRLIIAWLREEEWGVTSFLDLLLRIFRALKEEYGDGLFSKELAERLESLYHLSPDAAERAGVALLKEVIGNKTLLLLMENLDELFAGLGKEGQKQFRSFLQTNACITLATAQSLFNSIAVKNSPFYNFFDIHDLKPLTPAGATQLLANIARLEGKTDLESFIRSARGRDRIKAVDYLAGGNPRIYVIFFEFLTRESLDELVEPFMKMLDDLTPYYQARMAWLSPQQRKVIEFLSDRRHAITVKEIAQRCFITHQTASSQLKDLRDKGYVNSESIGRESFYELREPLMRFCLEVKKQRGEPIRLFVDFLRVWYSRTELQQLLGLGIAEIDLTREHNYSKYQQCIEPIPPDAVLEREYLLYALQAIEKDDEDPRVRADSHEYTNSFEQKDYFYLLQLAEKLVLSRGHAQDWVQQGRCLGNLKRYEEALASFDQALAADPNLGITWFLRGYVLFHLNRFEEALESCNQALALDPNLDIAWVLRGYVLFHLNRFEEALESYDQALALDPNLGIAWFLRGYVLFDLNRFEEALESCDQAIAVVPNIAGAWNYRSLLLCKLNRFEEALEPCDQALALDPNIAGAWNYRGNVLFNLTQFEEALESYDQALALDPNYVDAWCNRGDVLFNLNRCEEALESYDKGIALDPNYVALWNNRGNVLFNLNRCEEALESYDQALALDPNIADTWCNQGNVLSDLNRCEEALESYDQAIELDPNIADAWNNRGYVLSDLNRCEEALESYDQAIALDPNYVDAWFSRDWLLINLGRNKEALTSCDKAIALGEQSSYVFFNRAIALLAINHWDEGITALDNAFNRLADGEKPYAEDSELIIRNLFNSTHDAEMWKNRIQTLLEIYNKYQAVSVLGQGLVKRESISALMPEVVSDKAAEKWLEVWRELVGDVSEFIIPLRLLNAAVRYKITKGDRRVLLELPIEERNLLQPLLEIEELLEKIPEEKKMICKDN